VASGLAGGAGVGLEGLDHLVDVLLRQVDLVRGALEAEVTVSSATSPSMSSVRVVIVREATPIHSSSCTSRYRRPGHCLTVSTGRSVKRCCDTTRTTAGGLPVAELGLTSRRNVWAVGTGRRRTNEL
jgi:hypothetical protein